MAANGNGAPNKKTTIGNAGVNSIRQSIQSGITPAVKGLPKIPANISQFAKRNVACIFAACEAVELNPLSELRKIIQDEKTPINLRASLLLEILQYQYSKKPVMTDVNFTSDGTLQNATFALPNMRDDELAALARFADMPLEVTQPETEERI